MGTANSQRKISILDCTLRDGSYTIDFKFTTDDTKEIVTGLSGAGFKWIEVGHGLGLGAQTRLKMMAAATDEQYIEAAREACPQEKSLIGCFFIPGIGNMEQLERAKSLGLDFIRIGTNANEYKGGLAFVERAKEIGFTVFSNLMKSYVLSPYEICRATKLLDEAGADGISLVDSAGGMFPDEVGRYIAAMRDSTDKLVGYHGHNNLGLANACALSAAENGCDIIDTTLQGIGRDMGNATTEGVLMIMKKRGFETGVDVMKAMDLGDKYIRHRLSGGFSSLQVTSGFARFHSQFIDQADSVAEQFSLDPRRLVMAVSEINRDNPPRELFYEVAAKLVSESN